MKYLSTKEIKKAELDILVDSVAFFESNNIEYMLSGGTLLGAVRHKGFIPWDDDIDIMMTRPNYEKLLQLAQKNNKISDNLFVHSYELRNFNNPFMKICNHDILADEGNYRDFKDEYLWIDIFPIDGYPDSIKESKKNDSKNCLLRRMLLSKKRKNEKKYRKILLAPLSKRFLTNRIIKNVKKYNYDECTFAGSNAWGYGICERMRKEIFEETIELDFEGQKFKAPKYYDEYLTNIYGDYMKLPPKEKRVTHGLKAWYVDEN